MISKRLFTLLAASSLALSLTACSDDDKKTNDTPTTDQLVSCDCETGANCTDDQKKACETSDEDLSKNIADDLKACKFKHAAEYLEIAYTKNSTDEKIALQRSVLGLMNLLHHKNIQALLPDVGFTSDSVDFDILWAEDGIFKQMVSKEHDFTKAFKKAPHIANTKDEAGLDDIIKKDLTADKIVKALLGMKPELLSLAQSFETAAKALKDGELVSIDAGCSLDAIKFSASDLYTIAGTLNLLVSSLHLLSAYDMDFNIHDTIDVIYNDEFQSEYYGSDKAEAEKAENDIKAECQNYIPKANKAFADHILQLKDASRAKEGRSYFTEAARLLNIASSKAKQTPEHAFFGWNSLPEGITKDLSSILKTVAESSDGKFKLPLITPEITVDLAKIFDTPLTLDKTKTSATCTPRTRSWNMNWGLEGNPEQIEYDVEADRAPLSMDVVFFMSYDAVNTITGKNIFVRGIDKEDQNYCKEHPDYYNDPTCPDNNFIIYDVQGDYSSNFSSAWEDFELNTLLNPNDYFSYVSF